MASTFNTKAVHKDGKAELKIGIDDNAKIIDGVGDEFIIKNSDGTNAKIAKENIPYIPDNASDKNKLVTQDDLKSMMKNIESIISSANELAKIVCTLDDEDK